MKQPRMLIAVVLATAALLALFVARPSQHPELWRTPDQLGDQLFRAGKFDEAAKMYSDIERQAAAAYRAGEFKEAAAAYARVGSARGAFGRGNALIMLGKYDDAVRSYDRALELQPGWTDAQDNRALAIVRRDRMIAKGGDETGGQEKADATVFDKNKHSSGEEVQIAGGDPLSDEQLRAIWLRRVQTKPADFLRSKFAFQEQAKKDAGK